MKNLQPIELEGIGTKELMQSSRKSHTKKSLATIKADSALVFIVNMAIASEIITGESWRMTKTA
jgi:hypothetical protein